MKTAVVVLNWNGKKWLEKFLPSLVRFSKDAIIFIADNASSDDSLHFVRSKFPSVHIISHNSNRGYAKGYNDALREIDAEYFILINSDIEVTDEWITPIINRMDANTMIAACQPKLLDQKNKTKFEYAGASGGFIDNLGYPFCRGRIFEDIEDDTGQYNDATEVFWATGACLFLRSSSFWEIGGLDESFFAHQEEIDLCWRLKNKGYIIMVEPKSKVYHVGGGTLDSGSPFKTYLNFRNNHYMLFKNLHVFSLCFILPIRLFLDAVAAFSFLQQRKGVQHFLAIIKAHISFYLAVPRLILERRSIIQKYNLSGKTQKSIILKNKIRRIKTFSKL